MLRPLRVEYPGTIYHLMSRGDHGRSEEDAMGLTFARGNSHDAPMDCHAAGHGQRQLPLAPDGQRKGLSIVRTDPFTTSVMVLHFQRILR